MGEEQQRRLLHRSSSCAHCTKSNGRWNGESTIREPQPGSDPRRNIDT